MDEDQCPIYRDDNNNLYAYYPDTGSMYILKPGDFMGHVGKPMPGHIPDKGDMTMMGIYRLGD